MKLLKIYSSPTNHYIEKG